MTIFALGFLSGLLANWVIGMISRLFSIRYVASMDNAICEDEFGQCNWSNWIVKIHIDHPRWKRALADTLSEYLLVLVKFDNAEWEQSSWMVRHEQVGELKVDAARTGRALLFTEANSKIYPGDTYPTGNPVVFEGEHKIVLKVVRSIDDSKLIENTFNISKDNKKTIVQMG